VTCFIIIKNSISELPYLIVLSLPRTSTIPVTSHMGSHSVTCHLIQVNTACLNHSGCSRFTYPGGMEGWVDPGGWFSSEMV